MTKNRFAELAKTFHAIAEADPRFGLWTSYAGDDVSLRGTMTLSLPALDAWATTFAGDGARHAAAFLLNLWNSQHPWKVGRFDMFAAVVAWDASHLAAFQEWVRAPWRP